MASLLDRAPRDITADKLRAFLEEHHAESERIDYKQAIESSIAETLVAMANEQGGLIIVGVEEKDQKPHAWPGLGGKDWLDTLGNHNSLECAPPVRYEPAVIQLPENGDLNTGAEIIQAEASGPTAHEAYLAAFTELARAVKKRFPPPPGLENILP